MTADAPKGGPATRRRCRACNAPLVFARTPEGSLVPLDSEAPTWEIRRDMLGAETAVRSDALVSHFSVCPKANDFSRAKGKRVPG